MSKHLVYLLEFLILFIFGGCSQKQGTEHPKIDLTSSQWVSNKLFEAPDFRDTMVFQPDSSLRFFDAASVTVFSGTYSIKGDTVSVTFAPHPDRPAAQYQLLYQQNELIHLFSNVGSMTTGSRSNTLKYHRAPLSREIL